MAAIFALIFSRLADFDVPKIWSRIQEISLSWRGLPWPLILPNFAAFRPVRAPSSWKLPNLRPLLVCTEERKMRARRDPHLWCSAKIMISAAPLFWRAARHLPDKIASCLNNKILGRTCTTGVRLIYSKARHARHFMKNIKVPRKFNSSRSARAHT